MTSEPPEPYAAHLRQLSDHTVPKVFQVMEWLLVASALRWAARETDSLVLDVLSPAAAGLIVMAVVAGWIRLGLFFGPGFKAHGKPVRFAAAWCAAAAGAALMVYGVTGAVSEAIDSLVVVTSGASVEAPPSYPPETAEKTVNETGGQTTPESRK